MPEPDRELSRLLQEHGVPGAVFGTLDGLTAAGVADMSTGEPVTPDTRFAVGSLAKPMVATAVVRLGLPLDDPVAARVPELEGIPWAERATLRDLLGNRSRVPLAAALEFGDFPDEDDAALARFAGAVAAGEPAGDFWSYANAGWALLGRALEAATGTAWEAAMRALVFEPLGLEQTTFLPEAGAAHHLGLAPVSPWTPKALARRAPPSSRRPATCSGLRRPNSTIRRSRCCEPSRAASRSTAGSTTGVSAGRASTRCSAGTG